jgi:dTDP-4-amino-4,6-dideoxygalactose transaminase
MNKLRIPLIDLAANYQTIKSEIDKAINETVSSGSYILSDQVSLFEEKFAHYCNTKYAVGVASGTDALYLSLLALGVQKGDEVIVPANTFIASVYAVLYAGATPIIVDVNEETASIDVSQVEKKITSKTKVIMPVHLYGKPADMTSLKKITKQKGIALLEDACQAHGALYHGRKVGSLGDIAAFSFYPGKNLGAYGDAGAVTTNSATLMKKIRSLREYGAKKKYYFDQIGYNSRLDAIQASVLRFKLRHLDAWNKKRQRAAVYYQKKLFQDLPFIKTVTEDPIAKSIYHLFVIQVPQRDALQKYLLEYGIQTGIHYPVPVHLQKSLDFLGYTKNSFPIAEKLASSILSLPLYPEITKDQQDWVIEKIKDFYLHD